MTPQFRFRLASMRPAQKAPENAADPGAPARGGDRFNEAGAKSAGKLARRPACRDAPDIASMRAGAKSAGKRSDVEAATVIFMPSLQ